MLVTFKDLWLLFRIPYTRQHILRLQHAGKFPLRRKVGNLNFWTRDEVETWLQNLRKPNGPSMRG